MYVGTGGHDSVPRAAFARDWQINNIQKKDKKMIYNDEIIIYNECTNGGDRVYAYFDEEVGAMEAFGYSAYLVAKLVKDVLCLWDDKRGLPCAVLRKQQMEELFKLGDVNAQASSPAMVQLNLKESNPYEQNLYDQWLQVLKARKVKVAAPLPVSNLQDGDGLDNHKPMFGSYRMNENAVFFIALIIISLVAVILAFGVGVFKG